MSGDWALAALFAGGAGALVGSYLDVVRHRSRAGETVTATSMCPHCTTEVRGVALLPVLGWLVSRGRCRQCNEPIPARHLVTELGHALVWAIVAAAATLTVPGGWVVAAALGALGVLDVLAHLPRPGSGPSRLLAVQVLGYGLPVLGAATAVTALLELAAGNTTGYVAFTAATVVAAVTAVPAARAAELTAPPTSSPARPATAQTD